MTRIDAAVSPGGDATDAASGDSVDTLPAICPGTYVNSGGHQYRHDTAALNWLGAQNACLTDQVAGSSLSTHLAVAGDAAELGLLGNFSAATGNVWLGLSDRVVEGTFSWVTAEPTNYPPASGAPWDVSEPTGTATDDCVYLGTNGALTDNLCTATFDFVCECDGFANDPTRY